MQCARRQVPCNKPAARWHREMYPKPPGCQPRGHDMRCRCTRLCCLSDCIIAMISYLGRSPFAMPIAVGMPPRSPIPCDGDLPKGSLFDVQPWRCACQRATRTFAMGMRCPRLPPLYSPCHSDRIAHSNGDMPRAQPRWYDSRGVRSTIFPATGRLPDGTGEFPQVSRLPVVWP